MNLSKKTGKGANELSDALYETLSAGVDTADSINFLETATKTAKAGFCDTATSVDGLTTVLNSYGLKASETNDIANQMLITQNLGKTTFGELAKSMGDVTPFSSALGVSTKELFSSLASTTAQGLETSKSVTSLKGAISNIIKPSKEASDAAELLGIKFSASEVKAKGWMPFLTDLKDKLSQASPEFANMSEKMSANAKQMGELEKAGKKSSKEYKELSKSNKTLTKDMELLADAADSPLSAFAKMFGGVEGLNGVLMLTSDQGMSIYNDSMEQMESNTNALNDAYNKIDTTKGEGLKKSLNEFKIKLIEVGDKLSPLIDSATSFLGVLSEMDPQVLSTAVKIGGATMAVGGLAKGIGGAMSGIGSLVGGLGGLAGKLAGTATAGAGTAGAVSGVAKAAAGTTGATGLLAGGVGKLAAALGLSVPGLGLVAAGAVAVGTGGIYAAKKLKEEAIPQVDLFADKVTKVGSGVKGATVNAATGIGEFTTKISAGTKKAVGEYLKLDDGAKKSLRDLFLNSKKISKDTKDELVKTYDGMGSKIKEGMDKHYQEDLNVMKKFFDNSKNIEKEEQAKILENMGKDNEKKQETVKNYTKRINEILTTASNENRELTKAEQQEINSIQDKMRESAVKSLSDSEVESKVILERMKEYDSRITAEQAGEVVKNAEEQRVKSVDEANKQYDETVKNIIRMRDETGTITAEQADKLIAEAGRQKDDSITKADEMKSTVVGKIKEMNSETLKDIDENDGHIKSKWEKLKDWFANNSITRWIKSKVSGDDGADKNWTGSNYFRGGLTYLHDAPGKNSNYELYDLPRGTRIFNHDASVDLVTKTAEQVATKVANSVLSSFNGNSGNITVTMYSPKALSEAEGARQFLKVQKKLALGMV